MLFILTYATLDYFVYSFNWRTNEWDTYKIAVAIVIVVVFLFTIIISSIHYKNLVKKGLIEETNNSNNKSSKNNNKNGFGFDENHNILSRGFNHSKKIDIKKLSSKEQIYNKNNYDLYFLGLEKKKP